MDCAYKGVREYSHSQWMHSTESCSRHALSCMQILPPSSRVDYVRVFQKQWNETLETKLLVITCRLIGLPECWTPVQIFLAYHYTYSLTYTCWFMHMLIILTKLIMSTKLIMHHVKNIGRILVAVSTSEAILAARILSPFLYKGLCSLWWCWSC